ALISHHFFFNHTPTTEIYTLSLHDALPICLDAVEIAAAVLRVSGCGAEFSRTGTLELHNSLVDQFLARDTYIIVRTHKAKRQSRSEEHTSELQSLTNLVCRLLLEKKKIANI